MTADLAQRLQRDLNDASNELADLRMRLAAAERVIRLADYSHGCIPTCDLCKAIDGYEKAYSDEVVGFTGDPQAPVELMKEVQRATEGGPYPADLNFSQQPKEGK